MLQSSYGISHLICSLTGTWISADPIPFLVIGNPCVLWLAVWAAIQNAKKCFKNEIRYTLWRKFCWCFFIWMQYSFTACYFVPSLMRWCKETVPDDWMLLFLRPTKILQICRKPLTVHRHKFFMHRQHCCMFRKKIMTKLEL